MKSKLYRFLIGAVAGLVTSSQAFAWGTEHELDYYLSDGYQIESVTGSATTTGRWDMVVTLRYQDYTTVCYLHKESLDNVHVYCDDSGKTYEVKKQ